MGVHRMPARASSKAGEAIINYIDAEGYLRTPIWRQIQKRIEEPADDRRPATDALKLVQTLEPAGVGARNLRECLLLQLDALEDDDELAEGHDFELERALVTRSSQRPGDEPLSADQQEARPDASKTSRPP